MIQRSGCKTARRFKATQAEDKFMYMAIYEFSDMESFLNYQSSKARQELMGAFKKNFGERAELRTSVWEQVYPSDHRCSQGLSSHHSFWYPR